MQMMARAKPGVSDAAANADLTQAFVKSYEAELAVSPRNTPLKLAHPHAMIGSILTERGPNASGFAKVASWLGGLALVVLPIPRATVPNLLFARALRPRRAVTVGPRL